MKNNVSHIFESQGKKIAANSYDPVELKGNDNIYWISTGKIDIFAVDPNMKRSHIARIESEELFSGLHIDQSEIGLQAIGIVDTQIIQMTQKQFLDALQEDEVSQNAANAIDVWIQKLMTKIHQEHSEKFIMKVDSDTHLPVNKDIDIQARSGVTWVKIKKGSGCFLNLASYLFDAETDFIPICRNSWIHMQSDGEIETTSTFNRLNVWKKNRPGTICF